jgi:hypothetical protein
MTKCSVSYGSDGAPGSETSLSPGMTHDVYLGTPGPRDVFGVDDEALHQSPVHPRRLVRHAGGGRQCGDRDQQKDKEAGEPSWCHRQLPPSCGSLGGLKKEERDRSTPVEARSRLITGRLELCTATPGAGGSTGSGRPGVLRPLSTLLMTTR